MNHGSPSTPAVPPPALTTAQRMRSKLIQRSRLWSMLYLLLMPTLVGTLLFTYYPNIEVIKYAFYRWDGAQIEEFRGLQNFIQAFTADPLFWSSFSLVGILLVANLVKMIPSMFVAIAMHRLRSQRWQFIYRVLFVIPMVIPGLVFLLIWKAFFSEGMFNELLTMTGGMSVLRWLDSPTTGLPALASVFSTSAYAWNSASPLLSTLLLPFNALHTVFGNNWNLCLFGLSLLVASGGLPVVKRRWFLWVGVLLVGFFLGGPLRLPLPLLAIGIAEWLRRKDDLEAPSRIAWLGWGTLLLGAGLIIFTQTWTTHIGTFETGQPPWLGHSKLVIPALIIWGFPWVGTIGVLLYLAGLSNISQEVYEAAELDGVSSLGKIFRIELPLIMSQVRINLIFMTIGTLTDYAFMLILLGASGGPDNRGMVPGLYMYQKAFIQGEFGYACTLGMILFVFVLGLTIIYQKYVKVDK